MTDYLTAMSPMTCLRRSVTSAALRCCARVVAMILPLLLATGDAGAASKESKERVAKTACLSGDYAKGVALLAELYVKTNDPNYLFNQGRCFEQNGKYEEAIVRFREYQRKNKDAGHPVDPDAEKHIADCLALLGKDRPAAEVEVPAAPAPAPRTVAAPIAPTVPAATRPTAVAAAALPLAAVASSPVPTSAPTAVESSPPATAQAEVASSTASATGHGSGLRIGGIVAMAAGVAGIATGVVLNLKSNSLAKELEKSNTSYSRAKESDRARFETWSWVGYGVGGACVLGGAILTYMGYRQGHDAQVALLPSAGPGHVGAVLQGAF